MTSEEIVDFRKKYDEYMSNNKTEVQYLTYHVKDGILQMEIKDFTINCGAEGVEYEFNKLENGVVQVNIAEIGDASANCFGYIDLAFTVPSLEMGETYQFDVRAKSLGGNIYISLFNDFSVQMKEGAQGKVLCD